MEANQNSTPETLPFNDTSLIDRFPYASRLGSNDIPSDDEVEEIKEFLREPTTRIQQMDIEIASLLARVDTIRHYQAQLQKQVATCRSLLAVSRRLPEDILLEVFFRCLPKNNKPTLNSTTAPLLLTAVCRRWRILAFRTTKLWSAIHLNIPRMHSWTTRATSEHDPRTPSGLYRMVQMWLERSGTSPLTLSLAGPRFFNAKHDYDDVVAGCTNILLPFTSRLRHVSLSLAGDVNSLCPLSSIPAYEFQSLESLFLEVGSHDISAGIAMFNAPNLRKVSICYLHPQPSDLAFPWVRLTHLDFTTNTIFTNIPDLSALSGVLNQCTSLICLRSRYDGTDRLDFSPIYLPRLQRLSIHRSTYDDDALSYRAFAENFHAPSLRQICMQCLLEEDFFLVLKNCGQGIQRLELRAPCWTDINSFALSLQHCPSLRSLSIMCGCEYRYMGSRDTKNTADKTFFSVLNGDNESDTGPRCPLLQELVLHNTDCESLASLVSFLDAKENGDPSVFSPLIRFSTKNSIIKEDRCEVKKEIVDLTLKPFKDRGLLVEISQSRRSCPCCYKANNTDLDDWQD